MGTISITYSNLERAVSQTKSLSRNLTDYHSQITSTVVNKMSSLPGTDSRGYISAAESYASSKIRQLSTKATEASDFASSLDKFVDLARDADETTADNISTIGSAVVGKRTFWEKVGDWIYETFCVDLVNSVPIIGAIANAVKWVGNKVGNLLEGAYNWFKYKGGKYIWNGLKVVAGVIAAVAAAFVAVTGVLTGGTVLAVLAAIASVVVAVIAVVNGAFAAYNLIKAGGHYMNGEIGQARYYGEIDGFSDAVDKYDLGDAGDNARWETAGKIVDTTELACSIVIAVNGVANLFGVKSPITGKVTKYKFNKETFIKNVKENLGIKRKRYSIGPDGKAIEYNGQSSGYKVGERWSFKDFISSRKDGTGKQYLKDYLGFGATDKAFYNKNVIPSMAKNPNNTVQTVDKLFDQLSDGKKVMKTILDGGSVVDKIMNRLEDVDKIRNGIKGLDGFDAWISTFNFTNVSSDLSKITGLTKSVVEFNSQSRSAFR